MLNDVPNDLLTVNENQKYSYSEFRSMSAAPSISDLKDLPVVPKSVFTGPEKDKKLEDNRYLDWQYRILREDVHGTIREEWLCYLNPKTPSEKKIASKLRARTFIVEDILGVSYNTKKRHPKLLKKYWDENQRLLTVDSLVALVKGKNLLCIGSVLDRSELSAKNVVRVYFFQTSDILKLCNFTIDNETKDVRLVQFSASFFAYKPFLEKLRTLSDVPFPDEIIHSVSRHVENNDFLHPIIEFIKTSDLNMQELDCMNLKKPIILNEKQREAVVNSFSMKMSLIQGPPGTGKSYCGTIIAKIALLDPRCKVLCVCYTNHALDQYLENLLDIGVSENDIVRIGFAKVSDRVKSCSLFDLSDSQENAVSSKYSRHINLTEKNAKNQYWTFKNYLNIVNPEISDVFKEPDVGNGNFMMIAKDGKKLNGRHLWEYWIDGMSLDEVYKFYSDEMSMETMKVWCMNGEKRLELLRSWINEINNEFELDFGNKILEYNNTIEMLKELCGESDIREIRSKRIMGCTTTGAAKNSHLVEAFDANVLILEEAGEVLESHVVTSISKSCKQIIMIGDHKQLRPKINLYNLSVESGNGHDLNKSLFERLVSNDYPHVCLDTQHRMRPEISECVRLLTYPELKDHESTLNRPPIRGMQKPIVFIHHEHLENDDETIVNSLSKRNPYEVELVTAIVKHFFNQGYTKNDMVILTPYLAQLVDLKKAVSKFYNVQLGELDTEDINKIGITDVTISEDQRKVNLATIDNYQGEEADIVIASLTRSNEECSIGFMKEPQRVNVLLSRARNGLVLIGNMNTFGKSEIWRKLFDKLQKEGCIFKGFPLACEKHPNFYMQVTSAKDFPPNGGCFKDCGDVLPCGHNCPLKCHPSIDHVNVVCAVLIFDQCAKGHKYQYKCGDNDPKCEFCAKELEIQNKKKQNEIKALKEKLEIEYDIELAAEELEKAKKENSQIDELSKLRLKKKQIELEKSLLDTQNKMKNMEIQDKEKENIQNLSFIEYISPDEKKKSANEIWDNEKKRHGESNEALDDIMAMIGLESIKKSLLGIFFSINHKKRVGMRLDDMRLNVMMKGNPGTGKTTVARLYAKFLHEIGALNGSTFVETSGSKLVHEGVQGLKTFLDNIMMDGGGVLFVDEAYQLNPHKGGQGAHVLDYLLTEMENNIGKLVVVFAGYSKKLEDLLMHNEGLPSRFPYTFNFEDYTNKELKEIFKYTFNKKVKNIPFLVEDGLDGKYVDIVIKRLGRQRGKEGFGNARAVANIIERIFEAQSTRVSELNCSGLPCDDFEITREDMIGPDPSKVIADSEAFKTLESMIGLESIKNNVRKMLQLIKSNYERELNGQEPLFVSLNKVFMGNPGTGKTTVAKIYGTILKSLGLLSNGEVLLRKPSDFVGAHLGESEKNTTKILEAAKGKVLVIDEAYGLFSGSNSIDPYRSAVIDTIVAEVQNVPGDDQCVLLLGYKEQMEEMLDKSNPGLKRRFDSHFMFEDYSTEQLMQILNLKLRNKNLKCSFSAQLAASNVLEKKKIMPNFGNGGAVESLIATAIENMQTRINENENIDYSEIIATDFDPNWKGDNHVEEIDFDSLLGDLIGCKEIIAKFKQINDSVKFSVKQGKEPFEKVPFNFRFVGPPGTGKTTVAR
ncbi:P-loop containing nucleoside triphosphate hydrolase protein, partial [Rozella allomycis CSF55]